MKEKRKIYENKKTYEHIVCLLKSLSYTCISPFPVFGRILCSVFSLFAGVRLHGSRVHLLVMSRSLATPVGEAASSQHPDSGIARRKPITRALHATNAILQLLTRQSWRHRLGILRLFWANVYLSTTTWLTYFSALKQRLWNITPLNVPRDVLVCLQILKSSCGLGTIKILCIYIYAVLDSSCAEYYVSVHTKLNTTAYHEFNWTFLHKKPQSSWMLRISGGSPIPNIP